MARQFTNNNDCIAERENNETIVVFSRKYEKIWKLVANHFYIYRIFCKPLESQPNPYNVYIGKASDLVGFKNDDIHSKTHQGYLYDIIEITELPFVPNSQPIEIVKKLQQYFPNISHQAAYNNGLNMMRRRIKPRINSDKNKIYHWLKTVQMQFQGSFLKDFRVRSAEEYGNPLRYQYCDLIYDKVFAYLNDENMTGRIVGVINHTHDISTQTLQEWTQMDINDETTKLNTVVNEIHEGIKSIAN